MFWSASGDERTLPRLVAAAALVTTLAGSVAVVPRLIESPPPVALVSPDHPSARLDREIAARFGMERPMVWLLEARDGSVWTPDMLARVQTMTREVARIRGVIAPDVVSIASPNLRALSVSEAGMRPVYLMGEVPRTPAAIAALRARVDGNPMLRGTLVDEAGRAAMIVGNFRTDVDGSEIAAAALALRDRHRDEYSRVWAIGAPILAATAPAALRSLALPVGVVAAVLVLAAGWLAGWRRSAAALTAGIAAAGSTVVVCRSLGALVLPWTAFAALLAAVVAGAVGVRTRLAPRALVGAVGGTVMGFIGAAILASGAEQTLAVGALVGIPLGAAIGVVSRRAFVVPERGPSRLGRPAAVALAAAVLLALFGSMRLAPAFGLASYGGRYLPGTAAADLRALERLFPPPTSLALRVSGEAGFIASPAVLRALEHLGDVLADDPSVRHTMSVADLVKIVNRSFNDDRSEFHVLPDERGLIARYLALAYSPGFRRFVDRSLATAVVWVTLEGASASDVARVRDTIEATLAEHPIPDATVERYGGDGALTLAMAASGWRVVVGTLLVLGCIVGGIGLSGGGRAAFRAVGTAAIGGVLLAGLLGWLGQALDLVVLPLLAVTVVGAACASGLDGEE